MTKKQMLQIKVTHLEQALLQADMVFSSMEAKLADMQSKFNKFKITDDKRHLEQNNELIMNLIQERLNMGAHKYMQQVPVMPEDDITRDNFYEAIEEALDLCVYLTAFMLRLMKEKEKLESDRSKTKKESTT